MPTQPPLQQPVGKGKGRGGAGRGRGRGDYAGHPFVVVGDAGALTADFSLTPPASSPLRWLAYKAAACLRVFVASFFPAPAAPVVLLLCVACVTPMRFL
eukprot:4116679-Pleurochrysis_carterae.AAC.1